MKRDGKRQGPGEPEALASLASGLAHEIRNPLNSLSINSELLAEGVERLEGAVGSTVTLEEVLFVGGDGEPRVGSPRIEGAAVVGTVVEQDRDAKIRVFKYKKRKHYRRTRGHRQSFTAVRIDAVRA